MFRYRIYGVAWIMPKTCKTHDPECIDSRPVADYRRRRYRCRKCGAKFSTIEVPVVLKRGRFAGNGLAQLKASLGSEVNDRQASAIRELVLSFIDTEG